jgi:hypothetical protein
MWNLCGGCDSFRPLLRGRGSRTAGQRDVPATKLGHNLISDKDVAAKMDAFYAGQ